MEDNILISVIIPVYNVKPYLERCMNTVLNQTYNNLEIIMVDDGSTDGSGEICDRYKETDQRIIVIHKDNGGISSARNAALNIVKGKYICFVDSDDYMAQDIFEKLLSAVEENGCELAICGHYTERDGKITIEEPAVDKTIVLDTDKAIEKLIEDTVINNYVWDKIYKKSLFDNLRFPEGRAYEDMAIQHKLFARANKICRIPECLYYYQKRSGSISDHFTDDRKWYHNCIFMLTAKLERYQFFHKRKNVILEQECLASLMPTIYEAIKLGHRYSDKKQYNKYMDFLKRNKISIKKNQYVDKKEKKLLFFYYNRLACFLYCLFKNTVKSDK